MTLPTEHLFADTGENSSIALLKQHFPQCFDKDGLFLPDKLTEQLQTANVPVSREYYTMNWLGKSYAHYLRDCPPITLLGEDSAHNTQSQNQHSQNLLIKGDNLEVLKHLKNAYANQVKMIYIDPPYNTGSDGFVYQDDRKFTPDELAKLADMSTDEARRVLDFTAKKSNSHSAWLTFMYPRLYIARELLKDDGVIFISIDDNEQAQLKLLCDEVFGEENFYGMVSWTSTTKAMNAGSAKFKMQKSDEYILVYGKMNIQNHPPFNLEVKETKEYPYQNEKGEHYREEEIQQRKNTGIKRSEKMVFPILGVYPKEGNRWTIGNQTSIDLETVGDVFIKNNTVYRKIYKNDEDNESYYPLWINLSDTVGTSEDGKALVLEILGKEHGFETIKPLDLIEKLLFHFSDDNDVILDFFAGSGTTAHAVIALNARQKVSRKYICVQLPEIISKDSDAFRAGYKNIFEITQERIEKSAVKIQQDFPDYQGDLGFKIFETMPDFRATDDEISPQLEFPEMLHANLEPKQYETLLTTWCVYDGNALTQSVQSVELGGYSANLCGTTLYVVYPDFDSVAIKALLDKLDHNADFIIERIVLFGEMVESAKQRELKQALDTYNNKKNVHLSLLVRY
ncbi:site-specific DNA-methyltransferase [Moraxella catarrhalis]|uniref:site-specific DNA-methyltransferase (adenine-specific) n=1 Tax=Moraxella catarrhalis TaxID=480 RepID=A0A198UH72_MORCA|nr:DNA methyltransferase [Moraxella catarrhalis]OAU94996.1 Type III restriction-modification system methylation subunit [Moraxella catarrhalis]OAU95746.1 Type III restriction-modification system methylation subunit [Moraxella catarrhalis]OAU96892.1 Type III restriction-modification system methylation subunit [Moraxella catarrhalis]